MSGRRPGLAARLEASLLAGLAHGWLRVPAWGALAHRQPPGHLRLLWNGLPADRREGLLAALAGRTQPSAIERLAGTIQGDRGLLEACHAIARERRLPFVDGCALLRLIGRDRYGRRHWLRPDAARALSRLRAVAAADGIELEVVSSFRSIADQVRIIRRKLARGDTLAEILAVNAPPGCSEHHSGGAVDFAVPGEPVLTEDFEATPAFAWLQANAGRFGFALSYPRDNHHGYIYEPWHWCHLGARS